MPQIMYFTSHNRYSSKQTQGTHNAWAERMGACAAASAIWCANILIEGKKPQLSKPEMGRAQLLQVKYRWGSGGSDGALELLRKVNLKGEAKTTVKRDAAMRMMIFQPGVYHICAHGHAFAEDTRYGHYYHYDVASGLYGYDNYVEWKIGVNRMVPLAVTNWTRILCYK